MKKIFIIFLFLNNYIFAQSTTEINQFVNLFDDKEHKTDYSVHSTNNSNELELLLSGFFIIYKEFISSQDAASCVFHPSCSVYTMQTIKQNGFIFGILDSFDRLLRCNPFNSGKFPVYKDTKLLYDPVK